MLAAHEPALDSHFASLLIVHVSKLVVVDRNDARLRRQAFNNSQHAVELEVGRHAIKHGERTRIRHHDGVLVAQEYVDGEVVNVRVPFWHYSKLMQRLDKSVAGLLSHPQRGRNLGEIDILVLEAALRGIGVARVGAQDPLREEREVVVHEWVAERRLLLDRLLEARVRAVEAEAENRDERSRVALVREDVDEAVLVLLER